MPEAGILSKPPRVIKFLLSEKVSHDFRLLTAILVIIRKL